jgi:hypothetical protein
MNPKAAIIGSYNFGNYGDDLMAVLFGKELQKHGYRVSIFRLDEKIASDNGFETTHSVEDLFRDASVCIIGGGAHLISKEKFGTSIEADLEQVFEEMLISARKYSVPVYSFSIGGDGKGAETVLAPHHEAFFSSEVYKGGTVRLPQDIPLLKRLGKEANYVQDVLWLTSQIWPMPEKAAAKKGYDIGINLKRGRKSYAFIFLLRLIRLFRPDIRFKFIRLHLPNYDLNYEYQVENPSTGVSNLAYTGIEQFIGGISQLDLIVSAKLHLGLTGMTYKVPFLSIGAHGKTRALLRSIGFGHHVYDMKAGHMLKIAGMLLTLNRKKLNSLYDWSSPSLQALVTDAKNNLTLLENVARNPDTVTR